MMTVQADGLYQDGADCCPLFLARAHCASNGLPAFSARVTLDGSGQYIARVEAAPAGARTPLWTALSQPRGERIFALRDAACRLLSSMSPSAEISEEILGFYQGAGPALYRTAPRMLMRLLDRSGLQPYSSTLKHDPNTFPPYTLTLDIRELGLSFIGNGATEREARSIAASQAIPAVMASMPEAIQSIDNWTVTICGVRSFGPHPLTWLEEYCELSGSSDLKCVAVPKPNRKHSDEFSGQASLILPSGERVEVHGVNAVGSANAQRNAALRLLIQVDPKLRLPADIHEIYCRPMALTALTDLVNERRLGTISEKVEQDVTSLFRYRCTLRITSIEASFSARGFSKPEARAHAATQALEWLRQSKTAVARQVPPQKVPVAVRPAPTPQYVLDAEQKLRAAERQISSEMRVSLREPDKAEWRLKLKNGTVLTVTSKIVGELKVVRAVDKQGAEVAIPARATRSVQYGTDVPVLVSSIRSKFIEPFTVAAPTMPAQKAHVPISDAPRLVLSAKRKEERPEIEADPFVRAANESFRDGFLAFVDRGESARESSMDCLSYMEWLEGFDYAALVCEDCGAKNTQGARCSPPELEEEAPPSPTLHDRLRDATDRLVGPSVKRSDVQRADAQLLDDVIQALRQHVPAVAPTPRKTVGRTLCLCCARKHEPAQGLLCLNAGFALARLTDLDREVAVRPYRSVRLYGLRRKPKDKDFWAYVVVTNGSIRDCRDPQIQAYRDVAEETTREILTAMHLVPGRSRQRF